MEECINLVRPPLTTKLGSPLFQEELQERDREGMWDWKSSTFEVQVILSSTKQLDSQILS